MHLYPLLLFAIIVLSLLFLVMTGTGLFMWKRCFWYSFCLPA